MTDLPSKPVGAPWLPRFRSAGRFESGLSFHVVNDLIPDLPSQSKNAGDRIPSPLHLVPCSPCFRPPKHGSSDSLPPFGDVASSVGYRLVETSDWRRWAVVSAGPGRRSDSTRTDVSNSHGQISASDCRQRTPARSLLILFPSRIYSETCSTGSVDISILNGARVCSQIGYEEHGTRYPWSRRHVSADTSLRVKRHPSMRDTLPRTGDFFM